MAHSHHDDTFLNVGERGSKVKRSAITRHNIQNYSLYCHNQKKDKKKRLLRAGVSISVLFMACIHLMHVLMQLFNHMLQEVLLLRAQAVLIVLDKILLNVSSQHFIPAV